MKVEKIKGVLHFRDERRGEAKFSLIDGNKQVFKEGKWEDRKTLSHYFSGLRVKDTKAWFDGNDDALSRTMDMITANTNYKGITSLLDTLMDNKYRRVERLYKLGLNVKRTVEFVPDININGENKKVVKYLSDKNIQISENVLRLLGDPRFIDFAKYCVELDIALPIIEDGYDKHNYNYWTVSSWLTSLSDLLENYNYNMTSLVKYYGYISSYENMNVVQIIEYLKDYISQLSKMSKKGSKLNKYPKYLKSVHDITAKQFQLFKKEYNEEAFEESYSNKSYNFEDKVYSITTPSKTNDLKLEGMNLHHCVKDYIDHVIDGKCLILFMRLSNAKEESLLTIEVKGDSIVQVKGVGNRLPNAKEYKFLQKYCKINKLNLNINYNDNEEE